KKDGVHVLTLPLYTHDVSRLFLDIIRDQLEITITAVPSTEQKILDWSIEIINPHELENTYVAYIMSNHPQEASMLDSFGKRNEANLRKRFRNYIQKFKLFLSPEKKLHLEPTLDHNQIRV